MFLYDNIDFNREGRKVYNSDDHEFGIEIEFSGSRPFPELPFFHRTEDRSVRGEYAGEYVLSEPCCVENLKEVLSNLDVVSPLYDNEEKSTSVHIHLNMQDSQIEHIVNTAALYFMFEDSIMREYCKASRRKNHFCLGFFDAPYLINLLYSIVTKSSLDFLNEEDVKYSSINFQTLASFGTLEFRALHGTADKDEIYEWIMMLKRIKTIASRCSCDELIILALEDSHSLSKEIFGKEMDYNDNLVRDVLFDIKPALLAKIRTRCNVKLIEPRGDV